MNFFKWCLLITLGFLCFKGHSELEILNATVPFHFCTEMEANSDYFSSFPYMFLTRDVLTTKCKYSMKTVSFFDISLNGLN